MFYRKLLITVILALISTGAMAEWVGVNGDENQALYVNVAVIRNAGDMVKIWSLLDYKTEQIAKIGEYEFLSRSLKTEYDCKEQKGRYLVETKYSGNMGHGKVVYNNDNIRQWFPVVPDSKDSILWKIACGKQ